MGQTGLAADPNEEVARPRGTDERGQPSTGRSLGRLRLRSHQSDRRGRSAPLGRLHTGNCRRCALRLQRTLPRGELAERRRSPEPTRRDTIPAPQQSPQADPVRRQCDPREAPTRRRQQLARPRQASIDTVQQENLKSRDPSARRRRGTQSSGSDPVVGVRW